MAEKPKYDALREQYEMIRDEELTTAADQSEKFHERYAQLEADTKALNSETRILVKKLFPKEQMQQHLEDAKDGKAHLKPDSDKKTKKKS